MSTFGGSTDPPTVSSMDLMFLRAICNTYTCSVLINLSFFQISTYLKTHTSSHHLSFSTSTLVSNLMTELGLKWILNTVWPPLGTTPSDGLTTMPGRGHTSSTCLTQTQRHWLLGLFDAQVSKTSMQTCVAPGSRRGSVHCCVKLQFWLTARLEELIQMWLVSLPARHTWIQPERRTERNKDVIIHHIFSAVFYISTLPILWPALSNSPLITDCSHFAKWLTELNTF